VPRCCVASLTRRRGDCVRPDFSACATQRGNRCSRTLRIRGRFDCGDSSCGRGSRGRLRRSLLRSGFVNEDGSGRRLPSSACAIGRKATPPASAAIAIVAGCGEAATRAPPSAPRPSQTSQPVRSSRASASRMARRETPAAPSFGTSGEEAAHRARSRRPWQDIPRR